MILLNISALNSNEEFSSGNNVNLTSLFEFVGGVDDIPVTVERLFVRLSLSL